jgi:SNF2 family DNA or RNA helicase
VTGPQWKRDGAHLGVESDGVSKWPPAIDVYEALAEGRERDGIPAAGSGAGRGLTASSIPLVVRAVLRHGGVPSFNLIGAGGSATFELPVSCLLHDHVVLESTWHPLDCESRDEVAALLPKGVEPGPIKSLRLYALLSRAAATGGPVEEIGDPSTALDSTVFLPEAVVGPRNVRATLYPYQRDGWRWLQFSRTERLGGLLGDEMGLGKTLQVIALLCDPGPEKLVPALVIAPGSVLENWRREIAKFAPHLRVLKHHGPLRTGRFVELMQFDVIVTSYETAARDGGMMGMIEWPIVVLDEAQWIRNPNADRTKAVKRLRRQVGFAVTGTPVENRLTDFWSIMDFAVPGHLGDQSEFERLYGNDVDGAIRLERVVTPLMLRRRVADVAGDLPARIDIPVAIELSEDESRAYEVIRRRIEAEYGAAANLVAIGQLRMFCAHPELAGADGMGFSKFARLGEILEEIFASGEKAIIFTSFNEMADRIRRMIDAEFGVFTGCINGSVAIDDRQPLIDAFSCVTGGAALILNPRAGGAGLNITAANHVIHYNLEWNPALEDQASARAHRRGQTRPVTVHRLFCAGTVEEVVNDRLAAKRELAGAAVVGISGRDDDYAELARALAISPVKHGVPA